MFIQTETTPNPNSLKFLPGCILHEEEPLTFSKDGDNSRSPLVQILFLIPDITNVFLGKDFITVTKIPDREWHILKPSILTAIMEHFVEKKPVLKEKSDVNQESSELETGEEDPIIREIKELIETKIRPAVAQDGGDIIYRGFEAGIVQLELRGACSGCPSSSVTLKNGIENMLKHYVPEVIGVEQVAPA